MNEEHVPSVKTLYMMCMYMYIVYNCTNVEANPQIQAVLDQYTKTNSFAHSFFQKALFQVQDWPPHLCLIRVTSNMGTGSFWVAPLGRTLPDT